MEFEYLTSKKGKVHIGNRDENGFGLENNGCPGCYQLLEFDVVFLIKFNNTEFPNNYSHYRYDTRRIRISNSKQDFEIFNWTWKICRS